MFKIKIEKNKLGKYNVYNSIIQVFENNKLLYEIESARDMLHEKDAREIAELDIEEIKSTNQK
jgi:uncharacterized membrane protein